MGVREDPIFSKMGHSMISILVSTSNRLFYLERMLASLEACPLGDIEVLLAVTGNDQESYGWLQNKKSHYSFKLYSFLLDSTASLGPRNFLISKAQGEWLLFLGDDVVIPKEYWELAKEQLDKEHICFGGPELVHPEGSRFEHLVALAQQSSLSTGTTNLRHQPFGGDHSNLHIERKFLLCNFWIKASAFTEEFFSAEEHLLFYQLRKLDHNASYIPDLFLYHHKSQGWKELCKTYFMAGFSRIKLFFKYPVYLEIHYLLPLIFLFLHFSFLIMPQLFFLFITVYLALNLSSSTNLVKLQRKPAFFTFVVVAIQYVIVLSYALGSLYSAFYHLKMHLVSHTRG